MAVSGTYYQPQELNSLVARTNHKSVKFFHLNVRSARSKTDELSSLFETFQIKFDIVMLTETWYRNDSDSFFLLPGYAHFYLNRTQTRGGGVSMLISDNDFEIVPTFSRITNDYEVLCVRKNLDMYCVLYRPPNGKVHELLDFLDKMFATICETKCNFILGGDLNIDMLQVSHYQSELLLLLSSHNLRNMILQPTRITVSCSSLLDLFITNHDISDITAGVVCSDISDHLPIFMLVHKQTSSSTKVSGSSSPRYIQNINDKTLQTFRRNIEGAEWNSILDITDVNKAYDMFIEVFKNMYTSSFPLKIVKTNKHARKPWVTKEHLKSMRIKTALYQAFLKSRNLEKLSEFKSFRNRLNADLRRAKRVYYMHQFDSECMKRPDLLWKRVSALSGKTPNYEKIEKLLINGIEKCGSPLSNEFNNFFVKVGAGTYCSDAAENIPRVCDSIFFHPTDENEVYSTIINLRNNFSTDVDNLNIKPIKYVADLILPYITHIYNLAFSSGVFPMKMQIAKVIALFKSGDKNNLGNYRPISILPVFSKGLEKIIHSRITNFSSNHNLLAECQFGFRKFRSTETALLHQKEIILDRLEKKLATIGVFLDFSKAFDCIDHGILLDKLFSYGFRGVSFSLLRSYLQYRCQYVSINDHKSSILEILCGVPQGSILGPLLFLFYINDIISIDSEVEFIVYADDTAMIISGVNIEEVVAKTNNVLFKLRVWCANNSLRLNTDKSKAVFFQLHSGTRLNLSTPLYYGPDVIHFTDKVKTLGVFFSYNMSWNEHVGHICSKLSRVVGVLNKYRYILPTSVKLQLYRSLFYPHLTYAHLVWGSTGLTNFNTLRVLQKKAIRAVADVPWTSPSLPLFEKYKITDVSDIYHQRLILTYQAATRGNHETFLRLADLRPHISLYQTRLIHPWQIPQSRTNFGHQRIKHLLPELLNHIASVGFDITSFNKRDIYSTIKMCT